MKLTLLSSGAHPSCTVIVGEQPATAGRDPGADVRIVDGRISRLHCEFREVERGKLFVRDLGSKNGTFVDGIRIDQAFLKSGQKIVIGRLEFVVRWEH
ncbi:MAG: FHA domain-containing protein, partial [Thermoguttaceae bacterium]